MNLKRIATVGALALPLAIGGTVAPAVMASPSGTVAGVQVVEEANAALGWGSVCHRSAPYVSGTTASGWKIMKVNVSKWWTSSLQGTKCVFHHSEVVGYRKG